MFNNATDEAIAKTSIVFNIDDTGNYKSAEDRILHLDEQLLGEYFLSINEYDRDFFGNRIVIHNIDKSTVYGVVHLDWDVDIHERMPEE